jgi:hypothetical protein
VTSKAERNHPASQFGTDKAYLHWVSFQQSCLDGAFNQWQDGVGRNIAAHVRRAHNSGTGFKPPFSAVPMTDAQHKLQSQKGEAACLNHYLPRAQGWTEAEAKAWFDQQAEKHLKRWINE